MSLKEAARQARVRFSYPVTLVRIGPLRTFVENVNETGVVDFTAEGVTLLRSPNCTTFLAFGRVVGAQDTTYHELLARSARTRAEKIGLPTTEFELAF